MGSTFDAQILAAEHEVEASRNRELHAQIQLDQERSQAAEAVVQVQAAAQARVQETDAVYSAALREAERRMHGDALQKIAVETQRVRAEFLQVLASEREHMTQQFAQEKGRMQKECDDAATSQRLVCTQREQEMRCLSKKLILHPPPISLSRQRVHYFAKPWIVSASITVKKLTLKLSNNN